MIDAECIGEVDIVGWKGQTEIQIISETREYYLLREYRKANATSKPQPIESKAYKRYIDVLTKIVDELPCREEIGIPYIFRKLFDQYHDILLENFPGWDSFGFKMQKKLWLGDRRTGDNGTYFPRYYKPMQYLCATGKLVNFGQKVMRIQ